MSYHCCSFKRHVTHLHIIVSVKSTWNNQKKMDFYIDHLLFKKIKMICLKVLSILKVFFFKSWSTEGIKHNTTEVKISSKYKCTCIFIHFFCRKWLFYFYGKKTIQRYNYDIYTYIIIHLNDTCPFVPLMLGCKGWFLL